MLFINFITVSHCSCIVIGLIPYPKAGLSIDIDSLDGGQLWAKHQFEFSCRLHVFFSRRWKAWIAFVDLWLVLFLFYGTVWPKYDGTSNKKFTLIHRNYAQLRCYHILVRLYHKTKIKPIKGQHRQFKPFIVKKKSRVADKKSQTDAWLTVVRHQDCKQFHNYYISI